MPHSECLELSKLFGYGNTKEDETVIGSPAPKPQLAPQTGPHKEEPLLYPHGTEPYDEPAEFTD